MPHLIVLVLTQAELCKAVARAWDDIGVADGFDLDGLIAKTEEVIGGFAKADHGRLFVVPVTRVLGVKPGRPAPPQELSNAR
jgi:hypothetical protein